MTTNRIIVVVLRYARLSVAKLVEAVEAVLVKMTGNANFVTPNPDLADITTAKDELKAAAAEAVQGTKAQKAAVKEKRRALMLLMNTLKAYVQTVSNTTPLTAEKVALSSGLGVRKVTEIPKRSFKVKNLITSGSVKLTCPREKEDLLFDYSYSTTPLVAASFVSIGPLPRATRQVNGLIAGTKYYFRFLFITKDGTSDWSDVISIIVT